MNLEKFTERSRGFLQAAQTIAMRESHQRLAPEHLLKALMDDDQGLGQQPDPPRGRRAARVVEAVDLALGKLPKVSGDAQPFMDPRWRGCWTRPKGGHQGGRQLRPVERILMALCMVPGKAKDALDAGRGDAAKLNAAINDIRKGRTADRQRRRGL
jgi:ATP-dependent Clp protease ATP-binding subunit ClpB